MKRSYIKKKKRKKKKKKDGENDKIDEQVEQKKNFIHK
jgi:hypothetical protein